MRLLASETQRIKDLTNFKKPVIRIQSLLFVNNAYDFSQSLFYTGGTAHGFYRTYKNAIHFYDKDKIKIAVATKHGCLLKATLVNKEKKPKRYVYSYNDIDNLEPYTLEEQHEFIMYLSISGSYNRYCGNLQFKA